MILSRFPFSAPQAQCDLRSLNIMDAIAITLSRFYGRVFDSTAVFVGGRTSLQDFPRCHACPHKFVCGVVHNDRGGQVVYYLLCVAKLPGNWMGKLVK